MDALGKQIESLSEALVAHVRELVKIKSVKGGAEPGMPFGSDISACLDRALSIADALGFRTVNLDGYCGYAEYGSGDEYVCVLGHLDVVPAGEGWEHPPYAAEIHDGAICGRGTMDDKGPILAALYGLKAIKDAELALKRRVRIIFGTDEESGSQDIPHYAGREQAPTYGFTPDGEFPVIYSEKGIIFAEAVKRFSGSETDIVSIEGGTALNSVPAACSATLSLDCADTEKRLAAFTKKTGYRITCEPDPAGVRLVSEGKAAHGSKPYLGQNAIMQLFCFIAELPLQGESAGFIRFLNDRIGMETDGNGLDMRLQDEAGDLTINVGMACVGDGEAKVTLDVRYPGRFSEAEIMDMLDKSFSSQHLSIRKIVGMQPVYFPKDHELIRALLQVYEKHTGSRGEPLAIGGGTYAKTLPNTVAFGPMLPGRKDLNHMANEYIRIEELVLLAKVYAEAIYELAK